ncbi:MAG: 16S rRNA (cytosine(967)-C(5))-methyltransferase RsmB [Oscillospiraceae bacterium]|nr:16S rRNA (cytosine(967)-C(5))-methyltransferase RsmB [Oscillospiraceae bacterium]MBR0451869.1 16S rRNA (cytosine(967)-C(5))-methyltransferase RsmB [Oscillospiraceae bacterium]
MNVRKLAVQSLLRCEEGAYSNLVQKKVLSEYELTELDRSFYTALFLGTLSREITIDALLDPFLKKGVSGLDPEVRAILRAGVYQIKWMDRVPVHAAIDESVKLCRTFRKASASGLVNAVLRKVADCDIEQVLNSGGEISSISNRYSVDPGIAEKMLVEYGDAAEGMLKASLLPGEVYVRVNTGKTSEDELLSGADLFEQTDVLNCLKVKGSVRSISELIYEGKVYIEGYPAQYAASVLGVEKGDDVLDLCSAPGGKTMCMAMSALPGGSVTAVELYSHRAELVTELSEALDVSNVSVVCEDGRIFHSDMKFDKVLCDVPCSGYGEMASKPELRTKAPESGSELPALQMELLENGASLLRSGGSLVYSTCTVFREENEDVVKRFLEKHTDFKGKPISAKSEYAIKISDHETKFLPSENLPEGFYVALLTKL